MKPGARFEQIKGRARGLLQEFAWPQATALIERAVHRELRSAWEYPFAASEAAGGEAGAALPAAAAIFCSLASIHLVDDLLDEDPRGLYRTLGAGNAANLALAFQAAAHSALADAAADPAIRAELQASLATMTLSTAFGQSLDAQPVASEEEYWRAVEAKTPPLLEAALYMGARLGGAPTAIARQLAGLGGPLGRFLQVSDDLADALAVPAGADWQRPASNLALLFALSTGHPEREELASLAGRAGDGAALLAAQRILVRCGAVSYCVFQLVELSREARERLEGIALPDPAPLARLLCAQAQPLEHLLQRAGEREEPRPRRVSF